MNELPAMLEKATVRLEILRDRMRACNDDSGKNAHHALSLTEIPGWIEEQRELLAAGAAPPIEEAIWKQAWEVERQKFQQETLRTSMQADVLRRMVERLKSEGHLAEPWSKACVLCDLAREAVALLEQPLPAAPPTEERDDLLLEVETWAGTSTNATLRETMSRIADRLRAAPPRREPPEEEVRTFPIQNGEPIPWAAAEKAYECYAKLYGRQQSLERLAQRGGFGLHEWACLYLGHERQCRDADLCVMRALRAALRAGAPREPTK